MSKEYRLVLSRRRQTVRRELLQRGITHADLARLLGVSEAYVSQLLGPRPCRPITERTRMQLEALFNMRPGELDGQ